MRADRISIITVTYNSAPTIERTIRSLLAQTDRHFEHIIIDGASTDDTLKRIEAYRELYDRRQIPLTVRSGPDRDYYDAMNKGIRLASGAVIGILNSDDTYLKHTIRTVRRLMSAHPETDILMGAIRLHNGERVILKQAKNTRYLTTRHFNHPAMFVRMNCYQAIGGYRSGNVHNDYEWFLRAVRAGQKVSCTRAVLADFYTGGKSTPRSLADVRDRIRSKYEVYHRNGFSRLYYLECVGQEVMKYLLIRKER